MIFIDTNIFIDVLTRDPSWFAWSMGRLSAAQDEGKVAANAVVAAELARNYETCDALLARLAQISVTILPLDAQPAFIAGKAFGRYRRDRRGDEPRQVLPDFFIGAHAVTLAIPLLTRDPRLYRRYFPELTLITPETDHD